MSLRGAVALTLLAWTSESLLAQQPLLDPGPTATVAPEAPRTYGADSIVSTTHAFDFHLIEGTEGAINAAIAMRTCAIGPCAFVATLNPPTGALIQAVEFSGCDASASAQANFLVFRQAKPDGMLNNLFVPPGGTGIGAIPGCANFPLTLSAPHTVDNDANNYLLDVFVAGGGTIQFGAFRVIYRLQVSPAPAVATFPNDVPTGHPFFRFVEALAAAGITAGCGPGAFCPAQPVTRGEMAVFLAAALGLHFPN